MEDYLEKLCISLGIRLIYTNNKVSVLSSEIKGDIPTIRAHKIFKNCELAVAQAIVGYYTMRGDLPKNYELIEGYLNKNFASEIFKIKAPDKSFNNSITTNLPVNNVVVKEEDPALVEYSISAIVTKSFWGDEKQINPESTLSPSQDDVLELDIMVKPPVT